MCTTVSMQCFTNTYPGKDSVQGPWYIDDILSGCREVSIEIDPGSFRTFEQWETLLIVFVKGMDNLLNKEGTENGCFS